MRNVPAGMEITPFLPRQESIADPNAEVISEAPALSVVQIVERCGIPPITPTVFPGVQSVMRSAGTRLFETGGNVGVGLGLEFGEGLGVGLGAGLGVRLGVGLGAGLGAELGAGLRVGLG